MPEFIARLYEPLLGGKVSQLQSDKCEVLGVRDMAHAAEEAALYFDDIEHFPIADRHESERHIEIEVLNGHKQRFVVTCEVKTKYTAKAVPQ